MPRKDFFDADPRPFVPPSKQVYGPQEDKTEWNKSQTTPARKPLGFSWFPHDIMPVPISWTAAQSEGRLVHWNRHASGGHFAAMEKPKELWSDVEEFVKIAWEEKNKA